MTIKPINDNIVIEIKKLDKVTQSQSGIFIVNKEVPKEDVGVVVAIGQGRLLNDGTLIKPSVKIGDTVIFDKFAGTEIQANETTYLIIKENNILCII